MAKLNTSKYDQLTRDDKQDSYEGRILARTLSSRVLYSKKSSGFLVYLEKILYNWYDSTRFIKKSLNFRVDLKDKTIDR